MLRPRVPIGCPNTALVSPNTARKTYSPADVVIVTIVTTDVVIVTIVTTDAKHGAITTTVCRNTTSSPVSLIYYPASTMCGDAVCINLPAPRMPRLGDAGKHASQSRTDAVFANATKGGVDPFLKRPKRQEEPATKAGGVPTLSTLSAPKQAACVQATDPIKTPSKAPSKALATAPQVGSKQATAASTTSKKKKTRVCAVCAKEFATNYAGFVALNFLPFEFSTI